MIYVMQGDTEKVKIGLTAGPVEKRRKGPDTGHPSVLRVLHTMPGGRAEEAELHKRFAHSKVRGKREWFYVTDEVQAWLDTLDRHAEEAGEETALQWLARVGSPEATEAKRQWEALRGVLRQDDIQGGWTLWDILAAARKGVVEPLYKRNVIRVFRESGPLVFCFPVFLEACQRQGIVAPACAIVTGVRPRSHRRPQRGRWPGSSLRGYPESSKTGRRAPPRAAHQNPTIIDSRQTEFATEKK